MQVSLHITLSCGATEPYAMCADKAQLGAAGSPGAGRAWARGDHPGRSVV